MGPRRRAAFFASILLSSALVPLGASAVAEEPPLGATNLGFEEPWTSGDPVGWQVTADADGAFVVDAEGPEDSPSYADPAKTIPPHDGDQMLRIGTPKSVAETQDQGPTTVAQTFSPDGTRLSVSARILSWEFRDNDRVTISAEGATLDGTVTFFADAGNRFAETCDGGGPTCTFTIARDKKAGLLDSGWVELHFTTTPGTEVTLSYTIEGTANNSHATWGYFDAPSAPPVASFTSDPPAGKVAYEGSLVQLRDASYDPDDTDHIVGRSWTITGPGDTALTSQAPDPSFFPPQDGTYTIGLQVDSSDGQTATTTAELAVTNAPALVNALDVDVLAGESVPFLARFMDAGWLDTHAVTVPGATNMNVQADSRPGLTLGQVTADLPPGTASADITVDDGDGELAPGSVGTAEVTVIADDPARDEGDDTAATATAVAANVSRLSWLQEAGDVDVVEVLLDGATAPQPLLPGTEIVAALDEVPADYDLVLLALAPGGPEAAPYQMAPYQMAPYQMAPYQMAPYQMAPIERAPYQMAPYQMAPYQMADLGLSPYQMAPYQMAPYQMAPYQMAPLSSDPFVTATGTGGGDIDASELGIEGLLASDLGDLQVAGFSANRGLATESVLVRVDQPGTRLFAAVVGANGAHSDDPYRLRLESSVPFGSIAAASTTIREALDAAVCQGDPLVPGEQARTEQDHATAAHETLIITQLDRLRARAGSDAEWADFETSLATYAASVQGKVVSVAEGDAYEGWDTSPCSVDAANDVTDLIRDEIRVQVDPDGDGVIDGAWKYLVILGDDAVVPFRRTSSGALIGDESQYLAGSFLRAGTPLAAALASSQELTDDFYSDLEPLPFQSGALYLPDLATGRLVETPAEITAAMDTYVEFDGRLDAATALVTAHDFLADGGDHIAASLGQRVSTVADTSDTWTADSLRCQWLGLAEACAEGEDVAEPDIVSPNSHWTHYASLSADGFTTGDLGDILTSQEVAAAPVRDVGTTPQLVFTIGCHAGFSVPDDQSLDGSAHGIDPALDFAQSLAQRQAVFVASTGFGLGETEGLAGTELLMANFAAELLVDGVTAGEALLAAKRSYLGALSTTSTYDVKSLTQQALYGPPQYQVFDDTTQDPALSTAAVAASTTASAQDGPMSFSPAEHVMEDGLRRYWSVDGDVQITPGRPWQPRVVVDVAPDIHGVLITGGSFRDVQDVMPVVTRPTMEWEQGTGTLDGACHDSWWPADLTTVNEDTLVVVSGQFRCRDAATGVGTQRLYERLDLDVLDPVASDDFTPPSAGPLDLRGVGTGVEVSFPASDASGITRIVPLLLDPSDGSMRSVGATDTATPDDDGIYRVLMPDVTGSEEFVIQVVDGANNVTTLTGRGANLRYLHVDAVPPGPVVAGEPTVFTATITGWDAATQPVSYVWDFGDGSTATGTTTTATFEVTHTYGDDWGGGTATLRVWDANGALGTAQVEVEAAGDGLEECDPAGDVSEGLDWGDMVRCGVSASDDVLTFSVGMAAPVSDEGSYRLEVDTAPGKKKPSTAQFKYDPAAGSWTGPDSLVVVESEDGLVLHYSVDGREIGWRGGTLNWQGSVQSGVPGSSSDGIIDRLPDEGWVTWSPSSG